MLVALLEQGATQTSRLKIQVDRIHLLAMLAPMSPTCWVEVGRLLTKATKPTQGPLTAGQSQLQDTAFQGIANLTVPTTSMGAFNPGTFAASGAPAMTTEGANAPAATGIVGSI